MAETFRFKRSELRLPHKRAHHVAVTWNKATIIWGGYSSDEIITASQVHVHLSGKWTKKDTSGDVPNIKGTHNAAHVVGDKMFVVSYAGSVQRPH